eukprot:8612494-Alexandrium_andersonii.AAC.1
MCIRDRCNGRPLGRASLGDLLSPVDPFALFEHSQHDTVEPEDKSSNSPAATAEAGHEHILQPST